MISATIGPTRTRVRFPIGATETTAALMWFIRRVVGRDGAEGDVPRVHGDVDLAVALVGAPQGAPAVERDVPQSVSDLDDPPGEDGRAREARHERIARHGDEVGRRRELQHLALADHADTMRERRGVLEVVGHEDDRKAEVVEQFA